METTFTFTLPRDIILNANIPVNHRVKSLKAGKLRKLSRLLAERTCKLKFSRYTVDVVVFPPSKRRLDPPNLYPTVKPLIDGLTDADVWDDDDHTHQESLRFLYGGQSGFPDIFIIQLKIKGDEQL